MENVINEIVSKRLAAGAPQRIHIPWPSELGVYGANTTTDNDMSDWVANNVATPDAVSIVGICAGRAKRDNQLLPCIVVTAINNKTGALGGIRNTWSDGNGNVQ